MRPPNEPRRKAARRSAPARGTSLALLALTAALTLAPTAYAGKESNPYCQQDPQLDPANDLCNPLRYIPSLPLNATAAALYFAVAAVFTYNEFRYRGKYFLCLTIGTWTEGIGLVLRLVFRNGQNPHSTGLYIALYMFVVLSPCAFLAADYILLGRLAKHLSANNYLFIAPDRVSWIFVISDIITFCIQAAGGGTSASDNPDIAQTGTRIFLAGLILQLISFALFTCLYVVFLVRVYRDKAVWNHPGWKKLFAGLGWTCIMFLTRSFFRTVELSQGYAGYLTTHEAYWAGLDALPLWLGIAVYTWLWPPRLLTPETRIVTHDSVDGGFDGEADPSFDTKHPHSIHMTAHPGASADGDTTLGSNTPNGARGGTPEKL